MAFHLGPSHLPLVHGLSRWWHAAHGAPPEDPGFSAPPGLPLDIDLDALARQAVDDGWTTQPIFRLQQGRGGLLPAR